MTPRLARKAAILDNVRKDMNWLAWGEAAESLLADDPDMTIQDAADLIGQNRTKVSRVQKLLKVLSKPARDAIRANCTTPGGYPLPESCGLCLGDLANGGQGDQDLIERAVKVALARRMKLEKVQKLVDWVKKGGQPEDFGAKEPKDTPEDPMAAHWPQLGPGFKVKYKRGGGYEVRMSIPDGQQAWNAAMAAKQSLQGQAQGIGSSVIAPLPPIASAKGGNPASGWFGELVGGILWKEVKSNASQAFHRVFPRPPRWYHFLMAKFQKLEPKNQVWATFITLFLILMAGSFLISMATRLLTRLAYEIVYSHLSADPYLSIGHKPMDEPGLSRIEVPSEGKAPKGDPGQAGGQAGVSGDRHLAPSQGAEGNGGTQVGSAPSPPVTQAGIVPTPPSALISKPKAQVSAAKPVTVYVPAPTQKVDETGKIIGQAVTTMAGDAAKNFLGF